MMHAMTFTRREILQIASTATAAACATPAKPLRRTISARKPLFVVEGGAPMWALLPEDFRKHCAVMIHAGTSPFAELEKYRAAGIPVFIAVQGDSADGPPTPMNIVMKALEEFPNVIGCRTCELSCGDGFSESERRYLIDLITVCGERRALVNWQDMGYPYQREHIFMQAGRDRELFDALRKNGDSVILTEKNNGWGKYYQTRSLVLGMWAAGVVGNWGFNAEDWWWYEQGYGERFVPSKGRRGYKNGWEFASAISSPDVFYAQNVLCAMAGGATVYSFESMHAYAHADRSGEFRLTPAWRNCIYPLLRAMVDENLIPEHHQVLDRIRVAYQDSAEEGTELDGAGEQLYRPLYGARTPDDVIVARKLSSELLPKTGRYFYLPVLPALAAASSRPRFPHIIRPHQFTTEAAQRAYFDRLYPAESAGGALVFHINGWWFATNPHENENITEAYRFRTAEGVEFSGRLEPHSLLLVRGNGRKLSIMANNYLVKTHIWDEPRPPKFDANAYLRSYVSNPDDSQHRTTVFTLAVPSGPTPRVSSSGAITSTWDARRRWLRITINHNGPVSFTIAL
jgi:hypothetical protein